MPALFRLFTLVGLSALTLACRAQAPLRYTCFTDHILYDKWLKDPKRSVTTEGYYKYEKRFHPLSVATGGILAYERFVETGDSTYFRILEDQVRYFGDEARVDEAFDRKGIGIPYDWPFGRLKAPWYSGMTQGVALSLLIRYEHLTGDPAMEPLLRKIAYFMLQPEADGGCRSTTKEGYTWIEEYPKSAEHRHVLNGFINALIGLSEYSTRFPDDTAAVRFTGECREALRTCFDHYDKVEWSTYDRSGSGLTPGYMEYQLLQLQQVQALWTDTLLRDQLLLWTVYATEKPNNEKALHMLRKGWRPSTRLILTDSTTLVPDIRFDDPQKGRKLVPNAGRMKPAKAFRNDRHAADRSWTLAHHLPVTSTVELIDVVRDTFPQPLEVTVWTRDTITDRFQRRSADHLFASKDRLRIRIAPVRSSEVVLQLRAAEAFAPDSARIQLRIGSLGPDLIPWTAHERIGPMPVKPEEPYEVIVHPEHAREATVFYRTGNDLKSIRSTPWRARNQLQPGRVFVTDKPFVEVLVVHPLKELDQRFKRSRVVPYREGEP
jgi:hypothetical protein